MEQTIDNWAEKIITTPPLATYRYDRAVEERRQEVERRREEEDSYRRMELDYDLDECCEFNASKVKCALCKRRVDRAFSYHNEREQATVIQFECHGRREQMRINDKVAYRDPIDLSRVIVAFQDDAQKLNAKDAPAVVSIKQQPAVVQLSVVRAISLKD